MGTILSYTYNPQNPPWQMITYDAAGEIVSTRGIVMHILDELAQKLNFTYYIIDPVRQRNLSTSSVNNVCETRMCVQKWPRSAELKLDSILHSSPLSQRLIYRPKCSSC